MDDGQSLSGYLYRNDAMLLHDAICNYVTDVLKYVYGKFHSPLMFIKCLSSFMRCKQQVLINIGIYSFSRDKCFHKMVKGRRK